LRSFIANSFLDCLMDNHYHLLIETAESNLSKDMRQLNGVYTQRFNRWHGRVGHIFQSRYKAIVMQKESYLELARSFLQQRPRLHKSGQGGSAALSASGKVSSQA
jgi:hypothetical protein